MKQHMKHLLAAAAAALTLCAGQAQAGLLSLTGVATDASNTVTDYSSYGDGLLSYDLDLTKLSSTTFSFTVTEGGSSLASLSILLRNLSGLGIDRLFLSISGASFVAGSGTVDTDGFSTASVGSSDSAVSVDFSPALSTEVYFGDVFGSGDASDWQIDLSGLDIGDVVTITMAVPEPQSLALLIGALAAAGFATRRRRLGTH